MKNLENYGVQELSKIDSQKVSGGWLLSGLILLAVCIVASVFANDGNENTRTYVDGERVGV